MLTILRETLRLAAARWPQLLAWYLAGWLARYVVIEVAATFGATSALAGFLILPLAILARLGSYIAMFLTLRDAMPSFRVARSAGLDAVDLTAAGTSRGRVTDILLASILPFFAFYATWKLLKDDTVAYAQSALKKIDYFTQSPGSNVLDIRLDLVTGIVIVVAFAGRFLLKRYATRLPRWTKLVAVYLESVWVFLTLFLISTYVDGAKTWISTRAAIGWIEGIREWLSSLFAPLGWIWSGIEWALSETGALILLPLAWLTIAGVVFGRALANPAMGFTPKFRLYTTARGRIAALPKGAVRRLSDVRDDLLDRWRPVSAALLLIWRAGVLPVGIFVLAHTVLENAAPWLDLAITRLVGPHDLTAWWMNFDDLLSFVVAVAFEPLRISLIAAAYDFTLRKLEERRAEQAAAAPRTTAAD